eukprot:m.264038 g.264038  ORF g.264038 m.264038 type:complete len:170 (+) comp15609_c1_seq3:367-876(+)
MSATSRRRSSGDRSRARAALTSQSMQDLTQFKVAVDEEHCDDGAAEATLLLQKKPSPIRPHTQSLGHRRNRSSDLSFLRQEKLSLPQMPASPNGSPSLTRRMSKSLLELSQSVDNLAVETPSPVVRRRYGTSVYFHGCTQASSFHCDMDGPMSACTVSLDLYLIGLDWI